MSMSNLPSDLVEETVSRVPLKSMRAVRLTCKKWNTLSKSQIFSEIHIGRGVATREDESQMIVMKDYNVYLMSVIANDIDVDPSTESKGKLTCLNEQVKISEIFHCEGLLLFVSTNNINRLVVWNPYSGQTRWIKIRYSYWVTFRYALGYVTKKNESCRSHKILRYYLGEHRFSEIYDFDSGLLTTLDVTPQKWSLASDVLGLSLKGNTYWCTMTAYGIDHIICFDFTSERFEPLLRLPFTASTNDVVTLSWVREEKLAVLHLYDSYEIKIWITTKIEANMVSWSKFLILTLDKRHDITISVYGSFFIDEEKKVAIVSNRNSVSIIGEAGYSRRMDLGEATYKSYWKHMCSYVPSANQATSRRQKEKKQ